MKYVLDGYNVIGASDHVQLSDANKEDRLVEWLGRFITKGVHLVVVFDGQNEYLDFPSKERLPGITKITTGKSRSADDYIKDVFFTKKDTTSMVIVTSDNDILYHAKKAKIKTMTSDQFLTQFCKHAPHKSNKRTPAITDEHVNEWLAEFD